MCNHSSATEARPLFVHDCETCTFLGSVDGHDLYFHSGKMPTVIERWSSDGPDYTSGLIFANAYNPLLLEAKRRAVELNLLKE